MSGYYEQNPPYSYAEAPAPPPIGSEYSYGVQSPDIQFANPASPLVYPVSPTISPAPSRDSSRTRRNTLGGPDPYISIPEDRGRDRMYHGANRLHIDQRSVMSRSNSERSRNRLPVYVEVARTAARGRDGRSPSVGPGYYYEGGGGRDNGGRFYRGDGSVYSGSSRGGSQGHSRSHSKVRGRHSRSPSCDSCDSYDGPAGYEVGFHHGDGHHHHGGNVAVLNKRLQEVQLKLKQVEADNESKKKAEEDARMEKLRNQEIERQVTEKLQLQKRMEVEEAERAKRAEAEEKAKIAAEARRLLEEQRMAAEAEEAKRKELQKIIDAEREKFEVEKRALLAYANPQPPPPSTRRTYTKFSKTHLCKEALDERRISYTEEVDSFLVHRAVDKAEQNYLWDRTKEIRGYYRQIQDAADKAPIVPGPNGGYVKYVQIAGQPSPMALPVTFTQTPGGGRTPRVDPIKIKWTDIFRSNV